MPLLLLLASGAGAFSLPEAQALLKTYCVQCHQGKTPAAKLNLSRFRTIESVLDQPRVWNRMLVRVRNGEMPPQGKPAPAMKQREAFVSWVESTLRAAACADGISPGRAPLRRLNRSEYAATVRDLLNIHFNAGHALPADGAGGEGFDNAAETLFLSPVHAEKYLEAARQALEYGAKDPRARAKFLIAEPDAPTSPEQAALKILEAFLPRAFRRPARRNLATCVPGAPSWSLANLPRHLSPEQVQKVLDRCDRERRTGKRDFAILLLLARLGLRAGEVAAIKLEDIDWDDGLITVRGKTRRASRLPLPQEVGEAIAAYLL